MAKIKKKSIRFGTLSKIMKLVIKLRKICDYKKSLEIKMLFKTKTENRSKI